MTNVSNLNDKAIDIKGKKYVLVSDRILAFNENYPNGSITTELVSTPDADMVVIKATIIPDIKSLDRKFSDYSQATWGEGYINKTSAIENCSTSAVGRALAYMGIGVIDSIASVDEINKASYPRPEKKPMADITGSKNRLLEAITKCKTKDEMKAVESKYVANINMYGKYSDEIDKALESKYELLESNEVIASL